MHSKKNYLSKIEIYNSIETYIYIYLRAIYSLNFKINIILLVFY